MYFFVDESGHTGKNLFDIDQPFLYYGVLSSSINLDILAQPYLQKLKRSIKVERIHAADLGQDKLVFLAPQILMLHKKYGLTFDIYRIKKIDHALISFFDQVFDSGTNSAVSFLTYWSPLRYIMLLKIADLFDVNILKKAWGVRIELNSEKAQIQLIDICETIKEKTHILHDNRLRSLVNEALEWAQNHPEEIHYNASSQEEIKQITPNIIGFQMVLSGIGERLLKKKQASRIIVDQQIEFNKSQKNLQEWYIENAKNKYVLQLPFGMPEIDYKDIPKTPILFSSSKESTGLQLCDIFLWLFKRHLEGQHFPSELFPIIRSQMKRGNYNEISLNEIKKRWEAWPYELLNKTNLSEDDKNKAMEIINKLEARRLQAVKNGKSEK